MLSAIIIIAFLIALLVWYAWKGRAWFKAQPWTQGFFAWVEPIELALYKKSETILFARLKMVTGILLAALTQFGAIDLTPLMPFVPDQYAGVLHIVFNLLPLTITLIGFIDEKLRNSTTKPIELVAAPEATASPEVKAAIAQADVAKDMAVAAVKAS